MKAFNFECYFSNPLTGQTGWDIFMTTVIAESKEDARIQIKNIANFDCIILFNYAIDIDKEDERIIEDIINNGYSLI